jgi:hypothetical protein
VIEIADQNMHILTKLDLSGQFRWEYMANGCVWPTSFAQSSKCNICSVSELAGMWRDFVPGWRGNLRDTAVDSELVCRFFIRVRCRVISLLRCTEALEAIGSALAAILHLVKTDRPVPPSILKGFNPQEARTKFNQ